MAERMTTYNTGAPVPSVDVRDLYDNAENLDNFSNGAALAYPDRLGVSRQSLAGIRAASSYQHLGAYGAGIVFTSYNQTFSYLGEFYAPAASVVLPYTTTGAGAAEVATFRSVGDATLRGDLVSSDLSAGSSLVARSSVSVLSVTELLSIPLARRSNYHTYELTSYYGDGTTDGGGQFIWDTLSTITPDDGVVIGDISTPGRFLRKTEGLFASPYWYGLPKNSAGIDNTQKIQSVIDFKNFKFPKGFTSSTGTLSLKSNSNGFFGDAVFTLLDGMPAGTPIVIAGKDFLEDDIVYTRETCKNSVFYGGVFDGNKSNNQHLTNPRTAGGGDGGMHGLLLIDAINFDWHGGPVFRNNNTDGIMVWEWNSGAHITELQNVNIFGTTCTLNDRQGISVVRCSGGVTFHDGTFSFTGIGPTGKLPKCGIDLEPNSADDKIKINFTGTTTSASNAESGLLMYNVGTDIESVFDTLVCKNNSGLLGDIQMYLASTEGYNNIASRNIITQGGYGVKTFGGASGLSGNVIRSDYLETDQPMNNIGIGSVSLNVGEISIRTSNAGASLLINGRSVTVGRLTTSSTHVGDIPNSVLKISNGNIAEYVSDSGLDIFQSQNLSINAYLYGGRTAKNNIFKIDDCDSVVAQVRYTGGSVSVPDSDSTISASTKCKVRIVRDTNGDTPIIRLQSATNLCSVEFVGPINTSKNVAVCSADTANNLFSGCITSPGALVVIGSASNVVAACLPITINTP